MSKSYVGLCGSCKYCDLGDKYTFCYSTSFKCTERNSYVKADEKAVTNLSLILTEQMK